MPRKYTLIAKDHRVGAPVLDQDLSARHDYPASHPPLGASDKISQGHLELTGLERGDYHLDNFTEFHEGWRDTDTSEWDETYPLYSYWAMVIEGYRNGAQHKMAIDTASNDVLMDTTPVLTWPTDLEALEAPVGYPPGASVRDWLIGTTAEGKAYNGVLPYHFPGPDGGRLYVDFGGVEAVWDTIIFDEAHMPSIPTVTSADQYGLVGFAGARDWVDEIARVARGAARDMGLVVRPSYFMRTIRHPTDPTQLCAQFCFVDLQQDSGTETPVARYALDFDIDAGIYPVEYPLKHRRDGHSSRVEVITLANNDQATGFIWAAKHSAEGALRYPAPYHRRGYWGGAPVIDSNLATQAQADAYAQEAADTLWGARGTLTWRSRYPAVLRPGDLVELDYPSEGQDHHLLRVIDLDRDPLGVWTITAGEREISIDDIQLPRVQTPMLATSGQTQNTLGGNAAGSFAGGRGSNGAPRQRPIVDVATNSLQNVQRPQFSDVTAHTWQAVAAVRPAVLEDAPPVARLTRHKDPAGNDREWTSGADGTGHPHHYETWVTAAGPVPFAIFDDSCVLISAVCQDFDSTVNTSVTMSFAHNGATVPQPADADPLACAWRDVVVVTFGGTIPPAGVVFTMSERSAVL